MDGDSARRTIATANRIVLERVRAHLAERAPEAARLEKRLRPLVNKPGRRRWYLGSNLVVITDDVRRAVLDADRWLSNEYRCEPVALSTTIEGLPGYNGYQYSGVNYLGHDWDDELHDLSRAFKRAPSDPVEAGPLSEVVARLHGELQSIAQVLSSPRLTDRFAVPVERHPARDGRLREGLLAQPLAEDLISQIRAGHDLAAALPAQPSKAVVHWCGKTISTVLSSLDTSATADFAHLRRDARTCDVPLVPEPASLGLAYLSLGLTYLEELREYVAGYTEVEWGEEEHRQRDAREHEQLEQEQQQRRRRDEEQRRRQAQQKQQQQQARKRQQDRVTAWWWQTQRPK